MAHIPKTIDEVTTEWVAEATGLALTGVRPEIIGEGIGVSSAVYRLHLEGDDVPATLVLKLQALDEAAVFTCTMLSMYRREVKFFDDLAQRSPITVPKGFGGACSDDGSTYYLFMEDMGGHRIVDQNAGMAIADAEQAVDELARWHAEFWGDAEQYAASDAALSLNDEIYHGVLPVVFAEGWEKLQAEIPEDLPPTIADVAPQWAAQLPAMLAALVEGPTTVVHGDYRGDNIFFDANDRVVLLDFQITGVAAGSYDLAYLVTQSLLPEVAAEHEKALFDRYVAGLIAAGVPADQTEQLWEKYRVAALVCLVYPVVACRGVDLADERIHTLVTTMMTGCARAIDELHLRELL